MVFVPDMQILKKNQSGNQTVIASQILITFWLWIACLSSYTSLLSWQPAMVLKFCLILMTSEIKSYSTMH